MIRLRTAGDTEAVAALVGYRKIEQTRNGVIEGAGGDAEQAQAGAAAANVAEADEPAAKA